MRRAASAEHGDEAHAPVHPLADDADALAHRESRGNRPGAEAAHLAEEAEGQRRRHRETYNVERNFYLRVRNARDVGELAREESVGIIGILQWFESAMPKQMMNQLTKK